MVLPVRRPRGECLLPFAHQVSVQYRSDPIVAPQCEVARTIEARCRRRRVDDLIVSAPQADGHRRTRYEHPNELGQRLVDAFVGHMLERARRAAGRERRIREREAEQRRWHHRLRRGIGRTTDRCRGDVRRASVGAGDRPRLRSTNEVAARCRPRFHAPTPAVLRWQQFDFPRISTHFEAEIEAADLVLDRPGFSRRANSFCNRMKDS